MLPPPKEVYAACASAVAFIVTAKTVFHATIPVPVQKFILDLLRSRFRRRPSSTLTLIIEDKNLSGSRNTFYDDVQEYIGSTKVSDVAKRIKISKEPEVIPLRLSIAEDEVIPDHFNDIKLEFKYNKLDKIDPHKILGHEVIEISFEEQHRDIILNQYLPYIETKSAELRSLNRSTMIYTHSSNATRWEKSKLVHPSTFETMAMDANLKETLLSDINRFISRKEFYKRVGKAWKRGYLLYGPPGTGKSSLVAAIANHLKFDIYELQLGAIQDDSGLRKLLSLIRNGSILLLEDIDCSSVDLGSTSSDSSTSSSKVKGGGLSLGGILNSTDGVWCSSGEERIIIFTANHKDKIDPARLRPGRMDMHIHMGYCGFEGFRTLANNYLGNTEHDLFTEIEGLIEGDIITPAQVAEELMRTEDVELALTSLVKLLQETRSKRGDGGPQFHISEQN